MHAFCCAKIQIIYETAKEISAFFDFFSEEGGREGSGNGFLDRAHALSWVMLPLRGLGPFYCNGVIVIFFLIIPSEILISFQ